MVVFSVLPSPFLIQNSRYGKAIEVFQYRADHFGEVRNRLLNDVSQLVELLLGSFLLSHKTLMLLCDPQQNGFKPIDSIGRFWSLGPNASSPGWGDRGLTSRLTRG